MSKLNLPSYSFQIFEESKKTKIFDVIRKKKIILNPEEWVRQHWIHYLIKDKGFPAGLIAVEKGLEVNKTKKRCDIISYNHAGQALLMVECKAPHIAISQDTFDQIARYNIAFKLPYLVVSNGIQHYCAMINFDTEAFQFIEEIPNYADL